jgi:hypothetical protein
MNVDAAEQDASIIVSLYGQDGTTDATISTEPVIPYLGERRINLATYSLPLGAGWVGSAVVSSDRRVIALATHRYQGPEYSSGDGWNGGAYAAPIPSTKVFVPYMTEVAPNVFNPGRWSRLTVQNTGDTAANVYVNTYLDTGALEGVTVQNVGASRSYSWIPDYNPDGNRSVVITSTNPIVAEFDGYWALGYAGDATAWSTSYESIPAENASTEIVYADVFRVKTGLVETGEWVQWANVLVQNTSLVSTANITVTFNKVDGTEAWSFNDTIQPNSYRAYNTRYGGTGKTAADWETNLEADYYGNVRVESDQPLVGVSHSFWDYGDFKAGGTYLAVPAQGTTTLYAQFMNRKGGTPVTAWSKLGIVNVDDATGTLRVYFYDLNGNPISFPEAAAGCSVGPGISKNYNTLFGSGACGISAATFETRLGSNFEGTVMVSSTVEIVGSMNQIFTNRIDAVNLSN